jgi:hypothetical protein
MYLAMAKVGDGGEGKTFPLFEIKAENLPQARQLLSAMLEKYGIKTEEHPYENDKLVQKKDHTETVFWVRELGVINDLGWLKTVEEFQRREEDRYWNGLAFLNMNP